MIRPYDETDSDQIIETWREASLIAHPFLSSSFMQQEEVNLRSLFLPRSKTWVYVDQDRVVGFISMIDHVVGGIFVHPRWQRKGVGAALIDKARIRHAQLELEVFEANHQGRAFYQKYGFVEIGHRIDKATNQPMIKLRFDCS